MASTSESKYVPALRFHWLTPYYDSVVGATTRERTFKRALIHQAGIEPHHRILDLACGTGTLSLWIKQACPSADVVGVDGDAAILSFASRKLKQAGFAMQFDQALSFHLPYPDASFDRVVSSLFFHHLSWDDKVRTMREVKRILKPTGQLHIADWGKASNPLMRALFLPIQLLDGYQNTQDNVSGKLIELFRQAGFAEATPQQHFSTMFGTMRLYSAVNPDRPGEVGT